NRLLDRFANLARVNAHRLRNAGDEVASLHFHLALFADGRRGADVDLDLLRRRLADEEVVVLPHELHDRNIELVAAGADRRIAHNAGERDDRDLRCATADVDDHVAGRRLDGEADTDCRGHGLSNHEYFFGTGTQRRVAHRTLLHFGDTRGYTDDDPGFHLEDVVLDDEREEIPQHLLGHVEVGDDAILHRTNGDHAFRRASEHSFRLEPDALDLLGLAVDGDDGRLVQDDPLTLHIDESIRRAEVDTDRIRGEKRPCFKERPAHLASRYWNV